MIFLYFCEYFMCREVKAAIQTTGASASQSIPAEFQGYEVPNHVAGVSGKLKLAGDKR